MKAQDRQEPCSSALWALQIDVRLSYLSSLVLLFHVAGSQCEIRISISVHWCEYLMCVFFYVILGQIRGSW